MDSATPSPAKAPWSLSARLSAIIAVALMLSWLFGMVAIYYAVLTESGRLFDLRLKDSARLVLALSDHEIEELGAANADHPLQTDEMVGDGHYVYQVWRDGRLLYRSMGAPEAPLSTSSEPMGQTVVANRWYRTLTLRGENGVTAQVADLMEARKDFELKAMARIAPVTAAVILVIAGLTLWIIRRAVWPLRHAAALVQKRTPSDLATITIDSPPAELVPLLSALNTLFQRIDAARVAERRFTADAAHELKTPLAAMRVQAQLARRAASLSQAEPALDTLMRGVDRCSKMIEQLLSLSRVDHFRANIDGGPVLLHQIINDEIELHAAEARRQSLQLVARLTPVECDLSATLWGAIIRNLLDNAVRYTPGPGAIMVALERLGDEAVLTVEDTGPGIAEEYREKVFNRFFRLQGNRVGGTGLGLSIVRSATERMKGEVTLSAGVDGRGLCVQVRVPITPAVVGFPIELVQQTNG